MKLTVLENGPLLLQKSGLKIRRLHISRKLEDFPGVSGVTTECNNLQSVSETTELIFGTPFSSWSLLKQTCITNRMKNHKKKYDKALKWTDVGFPGGAVVESLPANAGDTGSSPGLGGSHMPRSNWAREPQLLSLRVWSLCSATGEAAIEERPAHRDEEWPPLAATGGSPRAETGTQLSQK